MLAFLPLTLPVWCRYGLQIGARMAKFVRCLMFVTSPISYPVGMLLDKVLGHERHAVFRRKQVGGGPGL